MVDRLLTLITYRVPRSVREMLPLPDKVAALTKDVIDRTDRALDRHKDKLIDNPRAIEEREDYGIWMACIEYYMHTGRETDGLLMANELYQFLNLYQRNSGIRVHKGDTLWMIALLHEQVLRPWHAQRCKLLAICEDALTHFESVSTASASSLSPHYVEYAASYPYLTNQLGMRDEEIATLFDRIRRNVAPGERHEGRGQFYPEAALSLLSRIDRKFYDRAHRATVSANDYGIFVKNRSYLATLVEMLGKDKNGRALEELALYLLSCVPGCRAIPDQRTTDAQHDVYGSFDGQPPDFRSEIGRYFICECKNWSNPVKAATLAAFSQRLHDAHLDFGILFSVKGLTGKQRNTDAASTRRKTFSREGRVIAVVTAADLQALVDDDELSFLDILRREYEAVKFDI